MGKRKKKRCGSTIPFVTCEVLAWRGVWNAEERRRRQNVDVGQTAYLGLPYYGRWLLTAARILVDKQYITVTELSDKIDEVRKRYGVNHIMIESIT